MKTRRIWISIDKKESGKPIAFWIDKPILINGIWNGSKTYMNVNKMADVGDSNMTWVQLTYNVYPGQCRCFRLVEEK